MRAILPNKKIKNFFSLKIINFWLKFLSDKKSQRLICTIIFWVSVANVWIAMFLMEDDGLNSNGIQVKWEKIFCRKTNPFESRWMRRTCRENLRTFLLSNFLRSEKKTIFDAMKFSFITSYFSFDFPGDFFFFSPVKRSHPFHLFARV